MFDTQAQINAAAVLFQDEVGAGFEVRPNGYGVRVECVVCHQAATRDRAYSFPYTHKC